MGHVEVAGIGFELPDGRVLLDDVTFRVGDGAKVALVGANGSGKTTLTKIIAGDLKPHSGSVARSGGLGVMRQFVGSVRDTSTVRDLLLGVAPEAIQQAAAKLDKAELAMMEADDEKTQLRTRRRSRTGARSAGTTPRCSGTSARWPRSAVPFDRCRWREVKTLSGGEQKRLVLEALLRGPDEVLMLDEPDNYLDVPAKRWLEEQLRDPDKTVLYISHDRELLANTATRIVTVELGAAGNTVWTHGGGFRTYHEARRAPVRAARGAAPALGRGARQAQGAGADVQDEGGLQRRPGLALQGGPDPAAQVRGGRSAAGDPARAEGQHAPDRRPHRQARGRLHRASS